MRLRSAAILSVTLFAWMAAYAESPRYTYAQIGYADVEPDGAESGDGPAARVSVAILPRLFVLGDYVSTDFDTFEIEQTTWNLGVGGVLARFEQVDLFAELAYVDTELDVPVLGKFSETGYRAGVGVRWRIGKWVELDGGVNYLDFGDNIDDTSFLGGVLVNVTSYLAVGVAATKSDNLTTVSVGLRGYFGRN